MSVTTSFELMFRQDGRAGLTVLFYLLPAPAWAVPFFSAFFFLFNLLFARFRFSRLLYCLPMQAPLFTATLHALL
jgi:hypothetical protein